MKKRLFALLAALILAAAISSSCASTVKYATLGSAEDIISRVVVYCDKWQELIGDAFGAHMAVDQDKLKKTQDYHFDMGGNQVATFDLDGISIDMDSDLNVYHISIRIGDEPGDITAATSRIAGVINAIGFDFPHDDDEMLARYMNYLTEYTDFMEKNKEKIAGGSAAFWTVETDNGPLEWSIVSISGRQRATLENLYFVDE